MASPQTHLVSVAILIFIGWRVYLRVRRNIGRQALKPHRLLFRIVLYGLVTLGLSVFAVAIGPDMPLLYGLAGGIALGIGLAFYGLHLTAFETTSTGRFYTPNPIMGVGLSLLLAGRLAYRLVILPSDYARSASKPPLMQSPLTMFLFGLLAGYYVAYFIGLLLHDEKPAPTP